MFCLLAAVFALFAEGHGFEGATYKDNIDPTDFSWLKTINSIPPTQQKKAALELLKDMDIPGAQWADVNRSFEQIVQARGYPVESHKVVTKDGYILTLHRIPHGIKRKRENKPAVLLMHGLLSSSVDWIILGTDKALAYLLANGGYDVWLGNARGNTLSRKHVKLSPTRNKKKFWNFSWHEIGYYDLPAMIDYILEQTKQDKLFHIGHSQGTTTFYVMASTRPEYNNKIRAHFSLAPVVYMGNLISPLLRISALVDTPLKLILNLIGVYEFMPNSQLLSHFARIFCADEAITQILCTNALFALCGFNRKQLNTTLLPIIVSHAPAGSSTRQLLHYGQEINSGRYCQFDHGLFGNIRKYGSTKPREYALGKVTVPVYLFYSGNDWMSAITDVKKLEKLLPNIQGKFLNPDPQWNHLDYIYGNEAYKYIYMNVIDLMKKN